MIPGVVASRPVMGSVPAGIVAVGSKTTGKQPIAFADGAMTGAFSASLPAGCIAGDTVVLACSAQFLGNPVWQGPAGAATALDSTPVGQLTVASAYLYTLTQADIDAGAVAVQATRSDTTSNIGASVVAEAYRSPHPLQLDVVGALNSTTFSAADPQTIFAPSVTTSADGDVLQYALFTPENDISAIEPPPGWSSSDFPTISSYCNVNAGHVVQSAAMATGDVPININFGYGSNKRDYGVMLFALRQSVPHITLAHNLPDLTVGQAFSGSLTAVNVDGATGDITLTASDLPDGITVGERTDYADGSVGFPVSGTPSTAGAFDATFDATNGTQSASYEWVGSVTQASGGAAHSYWRIYITANNGGTYNAIVEMQMMSETGGENLLTGGTPIASSQYSSGYGADKAFDGNTGTRWTGSTNPEGEWLGYQCASAIEVNAVTIRRYNAARAPKDFVIQSSDDGETWTDEWSVSGQTDWTAVEIVFTRN